jgi:hypothetical protein
MSLYNRDRSGWYGNDNKANRFTDPDTGETYFPLVNEETGDIELWNEDFGFADKKVGTLKKDGTWDFNGKWFSNVNQDDKDFANKIAKDGTLRDKAELIVGKTIVEEEGVSVKEAQSKAQDLVWKNKGLEVSEGRASLKDQQDFLNSGAGTGEDGTRNSGFGLHVFPKTLREGSGGQDFLKFDMMKYEPRAFDEKHFAFKERSNDFKGRTIGTVVLPIPGGIQDSQAVTWGGQTMTPLDMALANVALTTVEKGPGEGVSEVGRQANKIAEGFGDNKKALAAVIAGMASGGAQLLTRTTGAISNPNMELLFGGPNLRTFSFQYLLAPRDKKEADTVIKILRFFKQGMAPIRTKSRLFMKSPHTFKLSYRNSEGEQHKFLNKFKECALQSLGVDYAPNGQYSTYQDGVMTAYQMTMTYTELNPVYNDDYGNEDFPAEIGF